MGETRRQPLPPEELEEGIPSEEADAAMEAEFEDPALDEALAGFRENLGKPPANESRDNMPPEDKRGKPKR